MGGKPRFMSDFCFASEYQHSLDDKGRLTLPGKIREELQKSARPGELMALADIKGGCVALYPFEQWRVIMDGIGAIEDMDRRNAVIRGLVSRAESVSIDKAGRVLLPPAHRERAGLSKDVTLLGGLFKIEVWDRSRLAALRSADEADLAEIARAENIQL